MFCSEVSAIDLRSKLIVLEGLDFTGKSTQVRRLAARIREAGYDVVETGEPGGTSVGEAVRTVLLDRKHQKLLPISELLLFIACRAQVTSEVILPALGAGKTVVSSRYRLSSVAYQGHGRGIDLDLIRSLNEAATQGTTADMTVLIDVPAEIALARKAGDGDRIEQMDVAFYERVRQGFLLAADTDPTIRVVDGTGSVDEIADGIAELLGVSLCRGRGESDMMTIGRTE